MTEKDFLVKFVEFFFRELKYVEKCGALDRYEIDEFLETFHKEYYEVEFVKKDIYSYQGLPLIMDALLEPDIAYIVRDDKIIAKIIDLDFK